MRSAQGRLSGTFVEARGGRLFCRACRRRAVSRVLTYEPARAEDLRAFLVKAGFHLESRPHAAFFAVRPGVNVTAYLTGKLVVAGEQELEFTGVLSGAGLARAAPEEVPTALAFEPHAGSDESGKGDYFGPLCVAAVHVPDRATANFLIEKGVRDSKLIGDAQAGPLASLVRLRCPHALVVLPPPRYNELYDRVGNLNHLLAWAHAKALEDLLGEVGPVPVVVDQFAQPHVLERHLQERGRATRVTQNVRGEADVAVAAASIVARAEFLAGLAQLEARHGVRLPKGAGAPVVRAAREVAARGGRNMLREVAKLHFATTRAAFEP
jgi:ribonuclease HIII